jgi:LysR family transcriptional regulator, nitrogen assimilation regulatory protein
MSYREVECFVAAVRCGSFSAAAEALNLSQPALWTHISKLEQRFGTALFKRHARGVSPTEAGLALLPTASEIVDAMSRFEHTGNRLGSRISREIALGVTPTPARLLLPDLMRHCREHGRAVRVTLARSGQLNLMVAEGLLDAAICYDPVRDNRVQRHLLYREPNFLVGPPALVRGKDGPIEFRALPAYPLVVEPEAPVLRVAKAHGIALDVIEEIDVFSIRRDMIVNHDQCSVMSYGALETEIRENKVGARQIVHPTVIITAALIANSDRALEKFAFLLPPIQRIVDRTIQQDRIAWRRVARRRAAIARA